MKTKLFIVMLFALTAFTVPAKNDSVYVCDSTTSVAYHKTDHCKGLNRCRHKIVYVTIDEAKKMGKRECHICYK